MIGEQIKFLRRNRAVSIKELASKVGVCEGTVRCWECGKRTPKLDNIQKIAKVLKVKVEQLTEYL